MHRRPVSRILSPRDRNPGLDGHSSRRRIAAPLKLPTRPLSAEAYLAAVSRLPGTCPRGGPIWHCSRWGLPCRRCCQQRGGLLPHRFTLTRADAPLADLRSGGRSVFCGAFRRVSPPGRYPAPLLHGVRTFLEGGLRTPRGRPAFCATGGVETSACGVKRIVRIKGPCPSWPAANSPQDISSQMKNGSFIHLAPNIPEREAEPRIIADSKRVSPQRGEIRGCQRAARPRAEPQADGGQKRLIIRCGGKAGCRGGLAEQFK